MKNRLLAGLTIGLLMFAFAMVFPSGANAEGNYLYGVTYGNGLYVAVGDLGTILTSADGLTWTARTSGTTAGLYGVGYGNGTFVAVGEDIITSSDGITWTKRWSDSTYWLNDITYNNGTFIAVGSADLILTSTDGIAWEIKRQGTTDELFPNELFGIGYGNGVYVAAGKTGRILTSPDGTTWTSRTSGTTTRLLGVTYAAGQFIVTGIGTILKSTDAISWSPQTSPMNGYIYRVVYGNSKFVATGLTSTDGYTWGGNASSYYPHGLVFGNGIFVAVDGELSAPDIRISTDGITWTTAILPITTNTCSSVDSSLNVNIPCVTVAGAHYRVGLNRWNNSADPNNLYWELGMLEGATATYSETDCATIDGSVNLSIPCVAVSGVNYQVELNRSINSSNPTQYYWSLGPVSPR